SKKNKGESLFSIATNPSSKMSELFSQFYNDKKCANIKFKYIEGGVEKIINAVDNEEVQIGFVFVPKNKIKAFEQLLERKSLQFVLLTKTDIILSVGVNSPIYNLECVEIDQLKHLKFIQLEEDYFTLNDILSSSISNEKSNTYLDYQVITNSDHAMVKLLNSSDLCNIGGCWFKGSYKNQEIKVIPIKGYEKYLNFGYIKHKNRHLSKEAEEFISYIMDNIENDI
ncbi:MAG: LysR family transcriptional regulator substrate-binding protein, partial [Intestinibacter sp.]